VREEGKKERRKYGDQGSGAVGGHLRQRGKGEEDGARLGNVGFLEGKAGPQLACPALLASKESKERKGGRAKTRDPDSCEEGRGEYVTAQQKRFVNCLSFLHNKKGEK